MSNYDVNPSVTPDEPALPNPHSNQDDVHYRLYLGYDGDGGNKPITLCVQSFDYYDYTPERFLSTDAYETEEEAEKALADHIDRLFGRNPTEYVTRDDAVRAAVRAKALREQA